MQIEYSLIERTVERELLPMAAALGLAITPWGPLGGGVLTGKYTHRDGTAKPSTGDNARYENAMMAEWAPMDAQRHRIAKTVMDIADAHGPLPAQVAINWLGSSRAPAPPRSSRSSAPARSPSSKTTWPPWTGRSAPTSLRNWTR